MAGSTSVGTAQCLVRLSPHTRFWSCRMSISSWKTKEAMGDMDPTMRGQKSELDYKQSTLRDGHRQMDRWLSSSMDRAITFSSAGPQPPHDNTVLVEVDDISCL